MAKPKKEKAPEILANDERVIFLSLLDKYRDAKEQAADAKEIIGACLAQAKASGFTKDDLEFAVTIGTEAGEKKSKAKIRRHLFIARLVDSRLGDQLELFSDPAPAPVSQPSPGIRGFVPFSAEELQEQQEEASKH